MMIEPSSILTEEDMKKERTPEELSLWWEEKNREFASSEEGRQYILLKRGLTSKFRDEIYPLMILANIKYMGRSDIGCIPNLRNDNFDAIIRDYSCSPPTELKLEFTLAIDGHDDHLRMKYFIEHNYVSLTEPLSHTGTEKTGHKIALEGVLPSHYALLENNFLLIKNRAQQKCKPKSYGKNHILVIIIDHNISPGFDNEKDLKALKEFTETNLINLPLDFGELYILGLSGKTLLPFTILGTENSS
jgi:hypothetical protein